MTTTVTPLPLTSGTWTADPAHSTVGFSVRHLGLSKVRGTFNDFVARLVVGDELASSAVEATIQLASVDTGNDDRDTHLRSADFFDATTSPAMSFVSTSIRQSDDDYVLIGDLTLNGVTRQVSLDVEFFGSEVYPMDDSTRAGFSATTSISRKDFGISFDIPLGGDTLAIGDKVSIDLDVQLVAD